MKISLTLAITILGSILAALWIVITYMFSNFASAQQVESNTNDIATLKSEYSSVDTNIQWIKSALKNKGFSAPSIDMTTTTSNQATNNL